MKAETVMQVILMDTGFNLQGDYIPFLPDYSCPNAYQEIDTIYYWNEEWEENPLEFINLTIQE